MASTTHPEQDPAPRPKRRTFPAEYKLRIVAEYDAAPNGEKGAILRRERLCHSHIVDWRAARDAGAMATLVDKRTSRARPKKAAEQAELERLRKKVARLEKEGAQKDAALELLGKAHALLEMLSESAD
ncbi:transposase [Kitasatospora mediocidica]|uniref:transposase n=1 Tax=Kitasatospora mediocidica TaxID=58352 RepID=UPI0005606B46|nr:transposase [Kitasatospora mediocidica]